MSDPSSWTPPAAPGEAAGTGFDEVLGEVGQEDHVVAEHEEEVVVDVLVIVGDPTEADEYAHTDEDHDQRNDEQAEERA